MNKFEYHLQAVPNRTEQSILTVLVGNWCLSPRTPIFNIALAVPWNLCASPI